jgi:hypothetical protein
VLNNNKKIGNTIKGNRIEIPRLFEYSQLGKTGEIRKKLYSTYIVAFTSL